MPVRSLDLHGSAPDKCPVALLLIDVINDLEFETGEALLRQALPMAPRAFRLGQPEPHTHCHVFQEPFKQLSAISYQLSVFK